MCLAVPAKVIEITGDTAMIDVEGVRLQTSIMLLEEVSAGDYVIVHAGFAIQKLDETSALETIGLMKEALKAFDG
jgi:hydrogenase expression/formation protein HypC